MKIEIDIDAVLEWELSVKLRGKSYKTLSPSLEDALAFEAMAKESDNKARAEKIAALGTSLLIDPPAKLSTPQWWAVILAVFDYWKLHVRKNGQSIAGSVKTAMENLTGQTKAPLESGNSL